MRFFADENFPVAAIELLAQSYQVLRQPNFGASDIEILQMARDAQAILLSRDKDFGELVFRDRLPVPDGIVLFRISPKHVPVLLHTRLITLIAQGKPLSKYFTVIELDKYRQRPLRP